MVILGYLLFGAANTALVPLRQQINRIALEHHTYASPEVANCVIVRVNRLMP